MSRAVFALGLLAVMVLADGAARRVGAFEPARISLNYGFLLLAAYLAGGLFNRARLPRITGYIAAGILCGPFVLGFIDAGMAVRMKIIDDLALTFIALTAGCELRLPTIRRKARVILALIASITPVVAAGMATLVGLVGGGLPFAQGMGPGGLAAVGVLVGVIAVARSPTSAIAIIEECRARGPFTDTVFAVTVAMDSLVILLFAVAVSFSQAVIPGGRGVDVVFVLGVVGQLVASVAGGVIVGKGVAFYIQRVRKDLGVLLVALAFLISESSRWLSHALEAWLGLSVHLEPLLLATTAGFVVQNFTAGGEQLSRRLHAMSLPIFVVFFSMAGVVLNLGALAGIWGLAILFVAARMALVSGGGYLGSTLAGEGARFRRLAGFGFYTQAGVSLGLAQEVARRFPEWGAGLTTFLVACITLNEMIGPVAFKFALDRMGESGKAGHGA